MGGFKEYLEDYEAKDTEEREHFFKRLDAGNISEDEIYPPKNKFIKLKDPIATPCEVNIWSVIPFYGSTIIPLIPSNNKKEFDEQNQCYGFNSHQIDRMIDLVKEGGRLQFSIHAPPTEFENLEFLEPLFRELKPPSDIRSNRHRSERFNEYKIEFDTLSDFGFSRDIYSRFQEIGRPHLKDKFMESLSWDYINLKELGYEELAEEIGYLMITNTQEAMRYFAVFANLITIPMTNTFKSIHNFNRKLITEANELGGRHNVKINGGIPYEIGKFVLNKTVLYPETLDGCMKVIQEYDDYELLTVLNALNEGVKRKNIDIIEESKDNVSEILDTVWNDTKIIKTGAEGIKYGVSLNIGLIGELATGISGVGGVLAGLGYQVVDTLWGGKNEALSEKIAKFVTPNYLVSIYDFEKKTSNK